MIDIIATLESVDSNQLYSYGWSQGGALALIAAALNPKIVKTVAVYPFLSDFRRVLDLGVSVSPMMNSSAILNIVILFIKQRIVC